MSHSAFRRDAASSRMRAENKQAERGRPMEQLESAIRPGREVPGCVEFGDVRQAQIWLVKKFQQQQVIPLSSWKSVAKTVSN